MKNYNLLNIVVFLISVLLSPHVMATDNPELVLDSSNQSQLPKHYRNTDDKIELPTSVSSKGLKNLHAIGSAQYSEKELETVIQKNKMPLFIVDLRQESHGFLDGNAISWYATRDWGNLGKTPQQVEQDQKNRLANLPLKKKMTIYQIIKKDHEGHIRTSPIEITVNNVKSEAQLTAEHHLNYKRFYVTDGMIPTPEQLKRFIQFEKELPSNVSVYFHCRAGKGRTTLFMAMHDMMHNAKQVSFENIISRQALIGGIDLLKLPKKNSYKYKLAQQRIGFLKGFYQYSSTNH